MTNFGGHPRVSRVPGDEDGYYAERLAEPELLGKAILLPVSASSSPLAVPVGKVRRGGCLEFLDKEQAKKALMLLTDQPGFPNVRVVENLSSDRTTSDYWELRWGEQPPFNGCDYTDPFPGLLLGIHYGYSDDVIAELFLRRLNAQGAKYTRTMALAIIGSTRNPL